MLITNTDPRCQDQCTSGPPKSMIDIVTINIACIWLNICHIKALCQHYGSIFIDLRIQMPSIQCKSPLFVFASTTWWNLLSQSKFHSITFGGEVIKIQFKNRKFIGQNFYPSKLEELDKDYKFGLLDFHIHKLSFTTSFITNYHKQHFVII